MSTTSTQPAQIEAETGSISGGTPSIPTPTGVIVGLVLGLAVGFGPLLGLHFLKMWGRPEYQHFPFILAAIGYLIWTRWQDRSEKTQTGINTILSVVLAAIAWLVLTAAVFLYEPWFAATAAIVLVGAGTAYLTATYHVPGIWTIWLLCWLLVPIRLFYDGGFTIWLQSLSSRFSSQVLDLIGVNHLMKGNVMELPGHELFVDEACSGIVSVMSVVACAAIYGVWKKRGGLHLLLLLVAGTGWAIAMNIGRICAIATALDKKGWDWSLGTPHEVLGLALFCLTFIATVSTDQILAFLLSPIEIEDMHRDRYLRNPVIRLFNWCASVGIPCAEPRKSQSNSFTWPTTAMLTTGVAFAVLGISHVVAWGGDALRPKSSVAAAHSVTKETLPGEFKGWNIASFEEVHREENSNYGEFSKTWKYTSDKLGSAVTVSFDYPFPGSWHELSACYRLSGWEQTLRQVKSSVASDSWKYIETDFADISDRSGLLVYSIFDRGGEPVSPPSGGAMEHIWRRMRRRGPKEAWPQMYQVQIWSENTDGFSDQHKEELQLLLADFRQQIRQTFIRNLADH